MFTNSSSRSPYFVPASSLTTPPPLTEVPEKPKRCCFGGCKKKLSLTDFPCKCGLIHCSTHRASEAHACTYDYRAEQKGVLLKTMSTAVIAKKVEVI